FHIAPAVEGVLEAAPDRRSFTWTTNGPWSDLTEYRVSLQQFSDDRGVAVKPASWTFTTTIVPHVIALTTDTGTAIADDAEMPLSYPALIQIPNDPGAWDQSGLQSANMVFESVAEGGITRFTAVFQQVPDKVGPVRSGRLISLKLTRHYRGRLFLSGTSQGTF